MAVVTESFTGGCCEETPASSAALDASTFENSELPAWSIQEDYENTDYIAGLIGQSGIQSVSSLLTSTALTTSPIYPGYVRLPYTASQPLGARSPGQVANGFVVETILGFTDSYEYVTEVSGPRQSETINSAYGNQIHKEILAKTGKRVKIIVVNCAVGGTLWEQWRRGTDAYNNMRQNMKQVIDKSLAAGRIPFILPIVIGLGYANTQGSQTTDRVNWAENLKWLHRELNEDLLPMTARATTDGTLISRQEIGIPLIVSQTRDTKGTLSANQYWLKSNPYNLPQAGEELVTRLEDGIHMAGPIYQYPTWPNPGLHLTSVGYRSYGTDLGHYLADIFMGNRSTDLRWTTDESRWIDSNTIRLYYRRPDQYVTAAEYTVTGIVEGGLGFPGIATITGTDADNQAIIGQRIVGGTIEDGTFILGPVNDEDIGGNGEYYVTESQTMAISTPVVASIGIGPPNYYRGGVMIDDTGTFIATTDLTVTKGFTAWDGEGIYLNNELGIQSVEIYRPQLDVARAFIDIRFKERPTGPVILTYGMKPKMYNSVTSATITNAGSGGTNGTYALIVTGGDLLSGADAAAGTFRVKGGVLVEITFTASVNDGVIGGLYTSETLPTLDFSNAPGLTAEAATAVFISTQGGSPTRGIRGLIRDDTAWGFDAGGNPRFNHAVQQFQVMPPAPFPAPSLIKNGRGLVNTSGAADIATTETGHDRWFCQVQSGGANHMILSSTVDSDGEAFMVVGTNGTNKRIAYCQMLTNEDTINLRGRRIAFGGRAYRSDATLTADNGIALMIAGWTGTADAMPLAFINDFGDYGDWVLGQFYANTAGLTHIAAIPTTVPPTGGKCNLLTASAVIPTNVNNICVFAFTRDAMTAGDAVGLALKAEYGNTISGFVNETTGDVEDDLGIAGSVLINLATVLALDGTTDDGALFNSFTAAQPAGTVFFIPGGMTLATSVMLSMTVDEQGLIFYPGAKIKVLDDSDVIASVFTFKSNNTWTQDLEIDGNGDNQTVSMNAVRTSNIPDVTGVSPVGIRMLGLTRIYDVFGYGLRPLDSPEMYVENFWGTNIQKNGIVAQNGININTASAFLVFKNVRIERGAGHSLIDPATNAFPDFQIIGTAANPTTLFAENLYLEAPVNPTSSSAEGAEIRYVTGHINSVTVIDGSLAFSIAHGTQGFTLGQLYTRGANSVGLEIANADAGVPTEHIAVGSVVINGRNAAGTALTPRAISIQGATTTRNISIDSVEVSGFTDDGIVVAAGGTSVVGNVSIGTAQIDASSVTGAEWGDEYGIYIVSTGGTLTDVHIGRASIIGGDAALRGISVTNATRVSADVSCKGINTATGVLARIAVDGNILATADNIALTVRDSGANPTSAQLAVSLTNGGLLGSKVSVGSDSFIPYAAGFTGHVRDVNVKLWNSYSASSAAIEGVLDGAIGSTAVLANGKRYVKTTAAGTLTGWFMDSPWLLARVSTQFDKTNETLAAITGLSLPVTAGAAYEFQLDLDFAADVVGGTQFDMGGGTATATSTRWRIDGIVETTGAPLINTSQTALTTAVNQVGAVGGTMHIRGTIIVNAGGTLAPRFARQAAAGTSSILVGSTMRLSQVS